MTGLVGVFFRDGRAAAPVDLAVALAAVVARGSGAFRVHSDGPCALGIAALATTPEETRAPQPAIDPRSGVAVILDGRLDDRGGLVAALRGAGATVSPDCSDAQLVLAAYQLWGAGFAARLIGDFALALWNPGQRRLLCARDVMGIRPCYYAIGRDYFFFGSTARSVLVHEAVPRRPNLGMVGEYVAFAIRTHGDTLYADVRRLPPAHLLQVDGDSFTLSRYWDFDPERRIRYRDASQYQEQFRMLLRCAVADRLRGVGPIGVALSGGIDSSAVAAVAQQRFDEGGGGTRLRAYSNTYPEEQGHEQGYVRDESRYIDAVAARWGLSARRFPWTRFEAVPWVRQAHECCDIPEYPNATQLTALFRGARADGVRVMLTGEGGDAWQQGSQLPHLEMLEAGDLIGLVRELRYQVDLSGWGNALRLFFGSLVWPLIPGGIRRRVEARRRPLLLPPYVSPRFLREIGLEGRARCNDCADRFRYASRWQIAKHAYSASVLHAWEVMERSVAEHGIELRHPLLDRRLIEFGVAIPDHIKRRGPIDRYTMRQAMARCYPEEVRARDDKSAFDFLFVHALLTPEVQQVLSSAALLERPWLQPDRYRTFLAQALAQCRSGTSPAPRTLLYLWTLFAVEAWYQGAFGA